VRQAESHPASGRQSVRQVGEDGGKRIHSPPLPTPPRTREDVVWVLVKDRRRAHAAVRRLQHGNELRIYVDGQLVISHLHRQGAIDALQAQSAQYLEDFKELGWQQVRQ
jgi:hypothetical protein